MFISTFIMFYTFIVIQHLQLSSNWGHVSLGSSQLHGELIGLVVHTIKIRLYMLAFQLTCSDKDIAFLVNSYFFNHFSPVWHPGLEVEISG